MTYVLILMLDFGWGDSARAAVTHAEFSSQAACKTAGDAAKSEFGIGTRYVCVAK